MKTLNYIAMLGFATYFELGQRDLVEEAASKIVASGYGLGVGNLLGTSYYALRMAKHSSGNTLAVIEQQLAGIDHEACDILQVVANKLDKHHTLARQCIGGMVIGGGKGTLHLIQCFLQKNKCVVAISGTGGIVPAELDQEVRLSPTVDMALEIIKSSRHCAD